MTEPMSERTTLHRYPQRGRHDRATIDAVLDEGLIAHLGFVHDGRPVVIPTVHARLGDTVYLHGSVASRAMRTARTLPVCITVTLLDGLVLARCGFNSSMNYRSVLVFGDAREVVDPDEKRQALDRLVDHVLDGRMADLRPHTDLEMRQTTVLAVPLDEASAKVRTGGPFDEEEDLDATAWAGVLPLRLTAGTPEPAANLRPGIAAPASVTDWHR